MNQKPALRLLGAKEMLKEPPGTFFEQLWWDKESCLKLIEKFKQYPLICRNSGALSIFVDNSSSANIEDEESEYSVEVAGVHIFYHDLNIVGDANPSETLYLVYDNENLIDNVYPLKQLQKVRDLFIEDNYSGIYDNSWAFEALEEYKDKEIIDCNLEYYENKKV